MAPEILHRIEYKTKSKPKATVKATTYTTKKNNR